MAKTQKAEEYEVESIKDHRIALKNGVRRLEFQIKWKGYPNSQNTWESSESTANAKNLVDQYWATKGGGEAARIKCENILKGKLSEEEGSSDEDASFEEDLENVDVPTTRSSKRRVSPVATKKSPVEDTKKRKVTPAKSTTSVKKEAAPKKKNVPVPVPSKEEKPVSAKKATPTKKAVVATSTKKAVPSTSNKSSEDSGDEEFSESEIEKGNFRLKSNGWKSDAEKVIEVRTVYTDKGKELHGLVKWRDGKFGLYKTSELTKRIPQLLIKYYENKLTFEQKPKA